MTVEITVKLITSHSETFAKYLEEILSSNKQNVFKYSDAVDNYKLFSNAKGFLGFYCFYELKGKSKEFWYIGESSAWNLHERLKQHFQLNHKRAILQKIADHHNITKKDAKQLLIDSNVYIQFFPIAENEKKMENVTRRILRIESYLIGIFNPKYNF